MDNKAIFSLYKCYRRIRSETKRAYRLMKQAFPVGSKVRWAHGAFEITATVVEHNPYFDRLKVSGITGKEYWVDADKVVRYMVKP